CRSAFQRTDICCTTRTTHRCCACNRNVLSCGRPLAFLVQSFCFCGASFSVAFLLSPSLSPTAVPVWFHASHRTLQPPSLLQKKIPRDPLLAHLVVDAVPLFL
ncbi:unnamed protein product, partial [Ectocarpus sp. 13 AM-2016]